MNDLSLHLIPNHPGEDCSGGWGPGLNNSTLNCCYIVDRQTYFIDLKWEILCRLQYNNERENFKTGLLLWSLCHEQKKWIFYSSEIETNTANTFAFKQYLPAQQHQMDNRRLTTASHLVRSQYMEWKATNLSCEIPKYDRNLNGRCLEGFIYLSSLIPVYSSNSTIIPLKTVTNITWMCLLSFWHFNIIFNLK